MRGPSPDLTCTVTLQFDDGTTRTAERIREFDGVDTDDIRSIEVAHPCPHCDCPNVDRFDPPLTFEVGGECDHCNRTYGLTPIDRPLPIGWPTIPLSELDNTLDRIKTAREARIASQSTPDTVQRRAYRGVWAYPILGSMLSCAIAPVAGYLAGTLVAAIVGTDGILDIALILITAVVGLATALTVTLDASYQLVTRRQKRHFEEYTTEERAEAAAFRTKAARIGRKIKRDELDTWDYEPPTRTEEPDQERIEQLEAVHR